MITKASTAWATESCALFEDIYDNDDVEEINDVRFSVEIEVNVQLMLIHEITCWR